MRTADELEAAIVDDLDSWFDDDPGPSDEPSTCGQGCPCGDQTVLDEIDPADAQDDRVKMALNETREGLA